MFFPVPYLLARNPYLLGYYRLLFGFSQKAFYDQGPFAALKAFEDRGELALTLKPRVAALCKSLIGTAALLLDAIDPVALDIVHDLQLLTLGPQLRGSRNVDVGQDAVNVIFELMKSLLARYAPATKGRTMSLHNDSGLAVQVRFGGDPDVSVTQHLGTGERKLVAIEIKGGADVSNIWNRLGEAEKSHQSAKRAGFNERWTITRVDLNKNPATQRTAVENTFPLHRPDPRWFFRRGKVIPPMARVDHGSEARRLNEAPARGLEGQSDQPCSLS